MFCPIESGTQPERAKHGTLKGLVITFVTVHRLPLLARIFSSEVHWLTKLKELRSKLKITQEEAARLLGVSNNTWIRWERGQFRYDEEAVGLLDNLVRNACPQPCYDARQKKTIDWAYLAQHVRSCSECKRTIQFLYLLSKS
jgi:DNA-binding XRE family transcriptional regulator